MAASGLISPLIYILAFGFGSGSYLPKFALGDSYNKPKSVEEK